MKKISLFFKLLLTISSCYLNFSWAQPIVSYELETDIVHPVVARYGMVSSVDALATQVGVDILKKGGNAVDAAIAVGYALAVTYPQAGNLGGGGFMLIRTKEGKVKTIDFREMAPAKASRDMYLDSKGEAQPRLSLVSHQASGVPGTVAGFALAHEKYGSLPLKLLIQPAISLAEQGFIVNHTFANSLERYGVEVLGRYPNSRAIFFRKDGKIWQQGDRFVQPELAKSLRLIAKKGKDAFYHGKIAHQIVDEMAKQGGLITLQDLGAYRAIEREPVQGNYRGYTIYSMPPPSSGGIHLIQLLNILENFNLASMGANSADAIHVMAESMKYAYADRSEYLGDPDFVNVPQNALLNKEYAKKLAHQIDLKRAKPAIEIHPGNLTPYEGAQTTHYSIVDREGNAVSVTYTLNTNFGSGVIAGKSGILMNNQMDDFSIKPGQPNIYGLVGGSANAIAPYKRPLSSMAPTIVTKGDKTILVTGTPGGARIITTVLQLIVNTVDFGMNIAEATYAPRIHHQWLPDELRIEKGISADTVSLLQQRGHHVTVRATMGSTQSIMPQKDVLLGASDPRVGNALTAGY